MAMSVRLVGGTVTWDEGTDNGHDNEADLVFSAVVGLVTAYSEMVECDPEDVLEIIHENIEAHAASVA